jgi:hypothetical protein
VQLTARSTQVFCGWGLAGENGIERYRAAVGRHGQLGGTEHAEVVSWPGWAAGELGCFARS